MSSGAPNLLSRRQNGNGGTTMAPNAAVNAARAAPIKTKAIVKPTKATAPKPGQTKPQSPIRTQTHVAGGAKGQPMGLKVVIRLLPPGMTKEKVDLVLPEWREGGGKVDWADYRPGKLSTDPAKYSRPSRVYLHLISADLGLSLLQAVSKATWEDARSSHRDAATVGSPVVEVAIYKKVPIAKKRTDPRQGAIDQDPEFMEFLESLANPRPEKDTGTENGEKDGACEAGDEDEGAVAKTATTTPLLEYLKEKRQVKDRDATTARVSKASRLPDKTKKRVVSDDGRKTRVQEEAATEKSSRETVKILTKSAAEVSAAEAAKAVASRMAALSVPASASASTPAPAPAPASASALLPTSASASASASPAPASATEVPKSRRAGIAAAARLLQRDLGLSPATAHRRARHDAVKALEKPVIDKPGPGAAVGTESSTATTTTGKAPATEITANPAATRVASPARPGSSGAAPAPSASNDGLPAKRSRGGRGGRGAEKGKAAAEPRASTSTSVPSPAPAPTPTPIVLLRKRPEPAAPAAPAAPADPSTSPSITSSAPAASAPKSITPAALTGTTKATIDKPAPAQSKGKKATAATVATAGVTPGAVRGFVKHANALQGVTEPLLKQALEAFGAVTLVEMDRRKGFAFVDFSDHAGLVAAVGASPVAVAQGTVQVLERKDKKPAAAVGAAAAGSAAASGSGFGPSTTTPAAPEKEKTLRGRRGRGGRGRAGHGTASGGVDGDAAPSTANQALTAKATEATAG